MVWKNDVLDVCGARIIEAVVMRFSGWVAMAVLTVAGWAETPGLIVRRMDAVVTRCMGEEVIFASG